MNKQVIFYKEYNQKETTFPLLENKKVAIFRKENIMSCDIKYVSDAIAIICGICKLNPYIKDDFTEIKKRVVDSVLNN